MRIPRFRFSILSLLLFTLVVAVAVMLYQRHLAWREAERQFENILAQLDYSPETRRQVELLVQRYPRLAQKQGSLEWAMMRGGSSKFCRHFLELGADPNKQVMRLFSGPPIQYAVLCQREEFVRLLLEHGADVTVINHNRGPSQGNTLLHLAASKGNEPICELLLKEGLSLTTTNAQGETPLHLAILNAHVDIVKLFLKHGAPCQEDLQGRSLQKVAQWRKEEHVLAHLDLQPINEIIRLIEEHCQGSGEH